MAGLTRGDFRGLLLEGLVIVVSVVVALLVEDWRSNRQDRADVATAMAALDLEVRANLAELESFTTILAERHARLITMESEVDGSRPFSDYVGRFGGFRIPDLDQSAWARVSTDPLANRIAADRLREAFELYRAINVLLGLDDQVNRLVYGPQHDDPASARIAYRIAERIFAHQMQLADLLSPRHRRFLEQRP